MQLKKITPDLSVSSQITPAEVALAAKQGFKAIVNNRPDGESQDQPKAAEIQHAALQHGLEYGYLPVVSGAMTDRDADAFAALIAELPGPVLAFCRTGTRSATLWALAAAPRLSADAILDATRAAGYELDQMRSRIEARAQARTQATTVNLSK